MTLLFKSYWLKYEGGKWNGYDRDMRLRATASTERGAKDFVLVERAKSSFEPAQARHDEVSEFNQSQVDAVLEQNKLLMCVADAARDLVALWESQKIQGLPRADRNAAIEQTRERLIEAVHNLED